MNVFVTCSCSYVFSGSFSLGFCFLPLRRQNSTSWPPSRTCCASACVPHPSCSPSANFSPSSSTSCPDRHSSASSRYNTRLMIDGLVSTIHTILDAVTCSDQHLSPTLLCFQTLSDLEPSLTYITDMASKVGWSTTCSGWKKSFWTPRALTIRCDALCIEVKCLICDILQSTLKCKLQPLRDFKFGCDCFGETT